MHMSPLLSYIYILLGIRWGPFRLGPPEGQPEAWSGLGSGLGVRVSPRYIIRLGGVHVGPKAVHSSSAYSSVVYKV